jgi:hypothetical protein
VRSRLERRFLGALMSVAAFLVERRVVKALAKRR